MFPFIFIYLNNKKHNMSVIRKYKTGGKTPIS